MKDFNLEKAKQGKKVCCRDGRPARIICYDAKFSEYKICALIQTEDGEFIHFYKEDGTSEQPEVDLFIDDEIRPKTDKDILEAVRNAVYYVTGIDPASEGRDRPICNSRMYFCHFASLHTSTVKVAQFIGISQSTVYYHRQKYNGYVNIYPDIDSTVSRIACEIDNIMATSNNVLLQKTYEI